MRYFMIRSPKQSGAVLVFSLGILIVLTLIGVSAMSSASLQGKMAANKRSADLAFQAAESALINSETWLMCQNNYVASANNGATNIWSEGILANLAAQTNSWWQTTATIFGLDVDNTDTQSLVGVEAEPHYVIEHISNGVNEFSGCLPDNLNMSETRTQNTCLYQITARGTGATNTTQSILQTHFTVNYPRLNCQESTL